MSKEGWTEPPDADPGEDALEALPKASKDFLLKAHGRGDDVKQLSFVEAKVIAHEVGRLGLNLKVAPVREYVLKRMARAIGGVGSVPTPPSIPAHEYRFVEDRVKEGIVRAKTRLGRASTVES